MAIDPRRIAALVLVTCAAATANGAVIHVDDDQTAMPADGADWSTAFPDLQAALAIAAAGDEIRIAEGVYRPGVVPGETFMIPSGVAIYGGFDGVSTQFEERDPSVNLTILEGEYAGGAVHHVVTMRNVLAGTRLDGVVVRGGRVTSQAATRAGAGVLIVADHTDSSPTIANCRIENNVIIATNGADGNGAGVGTIAAAPGRCRPVIVGSTFASNETIRRGGGIHLTELSVAEIHDCFFLGNTAGAGLNMSGGGLSMERGCEVTLSDSTFQTNQGSGNGGALVATDVETLDVVGCRFEYNWTGTTGNGGGVYLGVEAYVSIDRSAFVGNQAGVDGGGVNIDAGDVLISNSIFFGNGAARHGGGVKANDGRIINCTIVHNDCQRQGGGARTLGEIHNSILWGNSSDVGLHPQIYQDLNGPTPIPAIVSHSNVQGGVNAAFGGTNLNADPAFLDGDGPDDTPGTWDDDLRITGGVSPCIDAGNNSALVGMTQDFYGRARLVDDQATLDTGAGLSPIVDIGAVEFPCFSYCPNDLNGDHSVDFEDLNLVLQNWGTGGGGGCVSGDADESGFVDFDDLNRLLLDWGATCP